MNREQRERHRQNQKLLRGCPRCGGAWTKQAGLIRCIKCGHVSYQFGVMEAGGADPYAGWTGHKKPKNVPGVINDENMAREIPYKKDPKGLGSLYLKDWRK